MSVWVSVCSYTHSCTVDDPTCGSGRVGSGREVAEEVRSDGVAEGGNVLLLYVYSIKISQLISQMTQVKRCTTAVDGACSIFTAVFSTVLAIVCGCRTVTVSLTNHPSIATWSVTILPVLPFWPTSIDCNTALALFTVILQQVRKH